MRNIAGQAVSGRDFFDRPEVIRKIMRELGKDSNILISSPRRVGKTSVLFHLADYQDGNYLFLYVITQSVSSENDFYRRLYRIIVESGSAISTYTRISCKTKDFLRNAVGKVKSIKIKGVAAELDKPGEPDYCNLFCNLMNTLPLDGLKLVIMIDEFTQTVENIMKKHGETAAVRFLQSMRERRLDEVLKERVLFIYTGSIGLENIAGRLLSSDLINDLPPVKVGPLNEKQAKQLVREVLGSLDFTIDEPIVEYMLSKIEWLIPFYIQLFIQEIDNIFIDEGAGKVTKAIVEKAFVRMLEHRNHFEHWQKRLRKTFKKDDYRLAEDILNHAAVKGSITSNDIVNIAVREKEDHYKDIVRVLVHDGYINNTEEASAYRFNSPILKTWWYKNVAN